MRLRHPDRSLLHLSYCSNVHPADDLDGVAAQLERYAARVRDKLDVETLGVGLWVAAPALADHDAADRLKAQLERLSLEVVTLNGFPYTAFHAPVVKLGVYSPDWTDAARSEYTAGLAHLLARLLPDDVEDGSISTLPLGWREGWDERAQGAALAALHDVAGTLERIHEETGKRIRLALEPEPGCTVETIAQACDVLEGLAPEWIGVCLDACHLAVQFETAADAAALTQAAGVPIVKAQVSSALRVEPHEHALLDRYTEPKFLHQVRERVNGHVEGVDDLPDAASLPGAHEWRVHFHVPVNTAEHTTQVELVDTLRALVGGPHPLTRHLEVETYTWSVMADDDDTLIEGLASELEWTRDRLVALGAEVLA
jgi:sugar phosphate isomerase/epimerase